MMAETKKQAGNAAEKLHFLNVSLVPVFCLTGNIRIDLLIKEVIQHFGKFIRFLAKRKSLRSAKKLFR